MRRSLAIGFLFLGGAVALASTPRPATAQEAAGSSPRWAAEDEVFYHVFVRSFRDSDGDAIGDLRGIQEGLDYLQELGVTSLMLTPIVPSGFYHNYFASSFEGVDAEYGDMRSYRELVAAVHERGMKIYLDQEIQYVAGGHPWLAEALGRPESEYSGWVLYNGPGNTEPEPAIFGIASAPIWSGDTIDLATLDLHHPGVQRYFQDFFLSLVDPDGDGRFEDGVDGFRIDHMMDDLDHKGKVTDLFAGFWVPIFERIRAANPDILIVAEQADWGFGLDWLTRGGADLVFAFPIRQAVVSLDRDAIAESITTTASVTPAGKGQVTFIENHDTNRFASEVGSDARKARIGAALNVLLQGTPSIYYGQEIGMPGVQNKTWGTDANDIPVREAFNWTRDERGAGAALWYEDTGVWWTDRFNRSDDGISVEEQRDDPRSLLSYYRRLLELRRTRVELRAGDQAVLATDQEDVLAVLRSTAAEAAILLVNLGADPARTAVRLADVPAVRSGGAWADLLGDAPVRVADGALHVDLPAYGVAFLTPRR